MAYINVTCKVPNGIKCTIITKQEGKMFNDVKHCPFRSSFYIAEEFKEEEKLAMLTNKYCPQKYGAVDCILFNERLKIDTDCQPFKCDKCLKQSR